MYDSLPMGVEVALYLPIREKAVQYTIFFLSAKCFQENIAKKELFAFLPPLRALYTAGMLVCDLRKEITG